MGIDKIVSKFLYRLVLSERIQCLVSARNLPSILEYKKFNERERREILTLNS